MNGVQQASIGWSTGCAVLDGGSVWCWGDNRRGQLGNGTSGAVAVVAEQTAISSGATQVAVGADHACAVVSGGVRCWGSNDFGQLGDTTTVSRNAPVEAIPAGSGIEEVRVGATHSCARSTTGQLFCWGGNFNGQLGIGGALPGANALPAPALVSGVTDVRSVSLGDYHTCVIHSANREASCWGLNSSGQIGNGTTNADGVSVPTGVNGLAAEVQQITAGGAHTCARMTQGAVFCWGANGSGQLGEGSFNGRLEPALVLGLGEAVGDILASGSSTCAATSAGARCWGRSTEGQLGNQGLLGFTQPQQAIAFPEQIKALTGSRRSICALLVDDSMRCWGDNFFATLARNELAWRLQPTANGGAWSSGVQQVSVGFAHTCVLKSGGAVECSGNNAAGQLGNGSFLASAVPVPVQGITGASAVASGYLHSCALVAGRVWCWGRNSEGQLGDGSSTTSSTPVQVIGLENATAITAGAFHTCAVDSGAVLCWGANGNGQLGTGNTDAFRQPAFTSLSAGMSDVRAGDYHTCAVSAPQTGGQVFCWGWNGFGQVGNGSPSSAVTEPTQLAGSAFASMALGYGHTCAASAGSGSVSCWGDNSSGQLGTGSTQASVNPVSNGLTGVIELSAGDASTCGRLSDQSVQCWGSSFRGNLGVGTLGDNALVPAPVSGELEAVSIASRLHATCAIDNSAGLRCWGWNYWGQFGDGTRQTSQAPNDALQRNPAYVFSDGFEGASR